MRVLVVDDEPVVAVGVRSIIQDAGHEVVGVAKSGEEALACVAEVNPDVTVIDIRLPGIDGIETTRRLTDNGRRAVIILTAYADQEFIEGAASAGAYTYLLKPVSKEMLCANIELAAARAAESELLRQEAADVRSALESRKLAERAKHVLMERMSLNEADAYTHMRQKCRNQNKTMQQVAEEIIRADSRFLEIVGKEPPKKM